MFQDFFNYKIIRFDKPVYNQNCIGLTDKVFSFVVPDLIRDQDHRPA